MMNVISWIMLAVLAVGQLTGAWVDDNTGAWLSLVMIALRLLLVVVDWWADAEVRNLTKGLDDWKRRPRDPYSDDWK